ncbi:MAG: oligoendopeptidase F [Desulfobacteraceae bacterium]|nr:oligoendopeptidase F [Desulfobacteraceae bacterium]
MDVTIQSREQVDGKYKWNAESVFPSLAAADKERLGLRSDLNAFSVRKGSLRNGAAVFEAVMDDYQALYKRVWTINSYAFMAGKVDMSVQDTARFCGQAEALMGQFKAATAFIEPELVAIGQKTLSGWMAANPVLAKYEHYLNNLFRNQKHLRSPEVEELLGLVSEPFSGVASTAGRLTDVDFTFPAAKDSDGSPMAVFQGSIATAMQSGDRMVRRSAWENYTDTYLAHKNTLAGLLETNIKQNIFLMQARRQESSLAAAMFADNVPVTVFHNYIDTFKKNLPTWHRYWRFRQRVLGLDDLAPYDIWAPLATDSPKIPFEQAVEWICQGLAPLGTDYVETMRNGVLNERWVDVYPNKGKMGGAFSDGAPGMHPFILMSYDDTVTGLSTLAHELGHSMHSWLTWQTQPIIYCGYSTFIAEVASNFHQAMVRRHLLSMDADKTFKLAVIEEALYNFHRYFFIMPTLARFEVETHERVENGKGLSADDMIAIMADLFEEGYGGHMQVDRNRVGITWATFVHLYYDYYVYQYGIGIAGAAALSNRVLNRETGAEGDYLSFLKAGNAVYPLDALKLAGVDMSSPEPIERAFEALSGMIDEMESLVG